MENLNKVRLYTGDNEHYANIFRLIRAGISSELERRCLCDEETDKKFSDDVIIFHPADHQGEALQECLERVLKITAANLEKSFVMFSLAGHAERERA